MCSRSGGLSVHTGLSLALLDELVTPVAPSTEGRQGGQTGRKKLTSGVRQQSAGGKLPQPGRRAVSREMSELRLVNAEPLGRDSSWGAGGAEAGRVGKSCRAWWAQGRTQAFSPGRWEPWRAVGRERAQCMLGLRLGVVSLGRLALSVDFSLFLGSWGGGCVLSRLWGHDRSFCLLQIPSGWLRGAGWRWRGFRGWFVLSHPQPLKGGWYCLLLPGTGLPLRWRKWPQGWLASS